ncbi:glutathione S-transferase family protein [Azohydromonas caseinilytica]|uniref:Glutathione S-transferase family protein n=1 Tax=Azohydromonas caseinilytica TaxID=2728836 RepID=A0A848F7H1_9BURK|nr:glutathione S-transferase family protein [Azohydromonas caseinilytica]NML14200.1 glutathione S-transferase family protein [Azohydromonas caseinilytica]
MRLVIGNKNYSSWSMRPWVLLKHFGIPFEEVKLRLDFAPGSDFYRRLAAVTPAGKVPVLLDGDLAVWDTLAITEYVAERFTQHAIWPRDVKARARARSICAEMHSGFTALRGNCGMNIEARLPEVGQRVLAEEGVRRDLDRIVGLWRDALQASGGPFLFGEFSAADAYYAPVVSRLQTYALPVPQDIADYMARVWTAPGVADWVRDALAEQDFLDFEEPYRASRG